MEREHDEDGLTERQKQILDFVGASYRERGFAPTIREICEQFDIKSTNGVNDHLNALKRKGVLTREENRARSLVLTTKGRIICGLARLKNRDPLEQAAKLALSALEEAAPALEAFGHSSAGRATAAALALRKAGVE